MSVDEAKELIRAALCRGPDRCHWPHAHIVQVEPERPAKVYVRYEETTDGE